MFKTLFYFLIALFILVSIHEMGHFLAARFFGVKVLRFSFGFGRVLFSRQDKHGTTFAWSLIPLGGYVKLLDEAAGPVRSEEKHLAFNTQSVLVRAVIILAGPLANFILAFFAFWCVSIIGVPGLAPVVGEVLPGSVAEAAGFKKSDEWRSINKEKVATWRDVRYALMPYIGEDVLLDIRVVSRIDGISRNLHLPLSAQETLKASHQDIQEMLGLKPFLPDVPLKIATVFEDTPAARAGVKAGDELLYLNGTKLKGWHDLTSYIKQHPKAEFTLGLMRKGKQQTLGIKLQEGVLGVQSVKPNWPEDMIRTRHTPLGQSFQVAFHETLRFTYMTVNSLVHMVSGRLPLKELTGPIGIAEGAKAAAVAGWVYYLSFLAFVSIGLGVLNLLPIPLLDGGQLAYILIEVLIGRPLSEKFKWVGVSFGILILMVLTTIALKNDLSRLAGFES